MTLPLEQSMEWEMTELSITLDPNGLWRRKRFEFCNALEDAAARPNDPQPWSVLKELGVRRESPTPTQQG